MTNAQLYLAIGVPVVLNTVVVATLIGFLWQHMNSRFEQVNVRFEDVNRRFDDMRELWKSELLRVEQVMDARLKHLEEHLES